MAQTSRSNPAIGGVVPTQFYPTPPRVVDLIAQVLYGARGRARSADTLRILDPCCGAGDALAQFAGLLRDRGTVPVETCGVELHRDRAEQAAHRLDRALACDLFATSIANNAFGVLYLNPPYDWDQEDKRVEHAFLTHCTRYLIDGGLLLFIVPKQRLAVSARYLSSHYRDLRCWAFPNPEREVFDQVVLVGRRKGEPSPDAYAEEQIREWAEGEPEEFFPRPYPVYDPPVVQPPGTSCSPPAPWTPWRRWPRPGSPACGPARRCRDSLWPADDRRTRPVDAPAPGPHGHAGGGRLSRQPGPGGRRAAHPGQGAHHQGAGPGRGDGEHRGLPGDGSGPPWWPWTWTAGRSPTSPPSSKPNDNYSDGPTSGPQHEGPAGLLRTGGASLFLPQQPRSHRQPGEHP